MTKTQSIQTIFDSFVTAISDSLREKISAEVRADIGAQLGISPPINRRDFGMPHRVTVTRVRTKPSKGGKRSPEQIAELTTKLLAHVKKNPGERIEQIAKVLNVPTKELALPTKTLLSDKRVRKSGTRRATKYFPK